VEFKAFGENKILDQFVANKGCNCNNIVTFGLTFFVNGSFGLDFQGL
jgi:hypothetical protein